MNELGYVWNRVDPCLYYKWGPKLGLIVWLTFIDDMLIVCKEAGMNAVKQQFTETLDCDDIGPMKEYIGTKVDVDSKKCKLKITEPVLWRNTPMMSNFSMCDSCRYTTATQNLYSLCEIAHGDKTL